MFGMDGDDFMSGETGNDRMIGGAGQDTMLGGGGDDTIAGRSGDDIMFGASSAGGAVDMDRFRIAQDATATVTFMGESAGYKNALGVYKIADDGSIYDVEIVFANASLQGSGGDLVSGESSVDVDVSAGDRLGFFVVPNGYSQSGMAALLSDSEGSFAFVDDEGNPGNVDGNSELTLVHRDADGNETDMRSQYGTSVFHSVMGENGAMNRDGMDHVRAEADTQAGTVEIGFEDLMNGGDKDFDDSVFVIDLGVTNTALLPRPEGDGVPSSDNDRIIGGQGDDIAFGMRGDDVVRGGQGDDQLWGNSGNDDLRGGAGNDQIAGGSGNDAIRGQGGNDVIKGNTGDDTIAGNGGADDIQGNSGNDVIADGGGHDTVSGGSGDDIFIAGSGRDLYDGDSGFDTIDYSGAKRGLTVDLSKHTVRGMGRDEVWSVEKLIASDFDDTIKADKRDNVIEAGAGNDVIRGLGGEDLLSGGDGSDMFVWAAKDIIFEGEHLGVDTITDFSIEDGDVLDLSRVVESGDQLLLTDNASGSLLSVQLGDQMVDVAQLDGVFGASVDTLLSDGMILA